MCYADDGESIPILGSKWVVGRRKHECSECQGSIPKGQLHEHSWGVCSEYGWTHWRICERCHYLIACIYALERAEGCQPWESKPVVGLNYVQEDIRDRGLYLPGDLDTHDLEDIADLSFRPVVRWWEIDAGGRAAARA